MVNSPFGCRPHPLLRQGALVRKNQTTFPLVLLTPFGRTGRKETKRGGWLRHQWAREQRCNCAVTSIAFAAGDGAAQLSEARAIPLNFHCQPESDFLEF